MCVASALVFPLRSRTYLFSTLTPCWKGLPKIMGPDLGVSHSFPCT